MLKSLKEAVYEANMELPRRGLVTYTWGNVSGIDRDRGLVVIKPSGVDYDELSPDKLVVLDLDGRMNRLGQWVQDRTARVLKGGGSSVAEGFVTSSLLFCVGAMSIVGALENGLTGNFDTLKAKSVLDGISSIIFASSLGVGVGLSAVPVLLYHGLISLAAGVLSPLLGDAVIAEMTCVGSLLIVAMGLNMLGVTKIKVMNLVPGIFLPILLCRIL